MPGQGDIRQRVEARISQGEFLAGLLAVATKQSSDVQTNFVDNLARIATAVRELLDQNGLVQKVPYAPSTYWPTLRGSTFAFIDGGVANIELPSAAPIGIRVGSYIVKPGDVTDERERFNIELSLVDDLYSEDGVVYDDDFEDIAKLRDAARIISEISVAYRLAKGSDGAPPPTAILLHGPLINPVSPYGLDGFPSFGLPASQTLLADAAWRGDETNRQFVALYLEVLSRLIETGVPVVGAVERSIGKDPVVARNVLYLLNDRGALPDSDTDSILSDIKAFGLNDASLFDVVLGAGEYLTPIPVMRQGPENKWPDNWKIKIRKYPPALTTYLKPSDLVMPFRVEGFESNARFEKQLALILHTSRLLPSYGFPVGLDIVDKFAKVPAWMSKGVRGQHSVVLLQKAIASGDPTAVKFAKRVLAAKGRDWLFRPSA